jgi:hypothetical protein
MRGTSRPTTVSVLNASGPKIWGTQYEANPSRSA